MRHMVWAAALAGTSLVAGPANASEWWYTGGSIAVVVFIDTSTIVRDRSRAEVWQYDVFHVPVSGVRSSKRRKLIDCQTLDARLIQRVDYDEAGKAGIPLMYTRLPPVFMPALSEADRDAHRFACADAGARVASGARRADDPMAMAATLLGPAARAGQ